MTALWLILFASVFVIVLTIAGWIADGNAPVEPWSPADWKPDYRTHPCGSRTCSVDHTKVNPWTERDR